MQVHKIKCFKIIFSMLFPSFRVRRYARAKAILSIIPFRRRWHVSRTDMRSTSKIVAVLLQLTVFRRLFTRNKNAKCRRNEIENSFTRTGNITATAHIKRVPSNGRTIRFRFVSSFPTYLTETKWKGQKNRTGTEVARKSEGIPAIYCYGSNGPHLFVVHMQTCFHFAFFSDFVFVVFSSVCDRIRWIVVQLKFNCNCIFSKPHSITNKAFFDR